MERHASTYHVSRTHQQQRPDSHEQTPAGNIESLYATDTDV